MRSIKFAIHFVLFSLLPASAIAHATSISGTVTNKPTGTPAAGDPVVLVDVQAHMNDVARTIGVRDRHEARLKARELEEDEGFVW